MKLLILFLLFLTLTNPSLANLPWLKASGLDIVNENGQKVVLSGVNLSNNVWGTWVNGVSEKLQKEGCDPLVRPKQQDSWVLTDSDFERLKKLGPKVVRYAINYELFAEDNPYRTANTEKLIQHIKNFEQIGAYTIVSLHNPQGLDVQNDNYERDKPANQRVQSIFENKEYWYNTLKLWQYLAETLKQESAIAGYYLFNEPRLPSLADGGLAEFTQKYNQLCQVIREVDQKHIIFVPEYNSKEQDNTNQNVVWERDFIKVNDKNIVYTFSFYEPHNYTHLGQAILDRGAAEKYLQKRVAWAKKIGQAPILIAEYGVNQRQNTKKRLQYLKFVHRLARKYQLGALLWEYKSAVNAYVKPDYIFGLYGHYFTYSREVFNGNQFQPWVRQAAKESGFKQLFEKYFKNNNSNISLMDNQPIWNELHRFYGSG